MSNPVDRLRDALRAMSLDDLVRNSDCVEEEIERRRDALLNAKDAALEAAQTFYMRLEQLKADKKDRGL